MNVLTLQQELRDFAASIGVDKIGFTTAAPFVDLKHLLKQQQELNYQSGFEEENIALRTEPTLLLEEAASIVAIAVAYPSRMENVPTGKKGARRGIFCRASWGTDYHTVLREKLCAIETFLAEKVPGVKFRSMVDTGELVDRAVAERAGIGWSAKNCSIITPEFGSYVYLGEMITNIPFVADTAIEDACGDCTLCIDVCPTGAIVQGGQLDSNRCVAFQTQTKGFLPDEFREKIGNRIYGCDTCQTVCPKNKGKKNWLHEAFQPEPELVKPLLAPLLSMTNKEFKTQFGHMSGSWRGKKPIQRNAIIALAHFKEIDAMPQLIALLEQDERPMIRGTAAWAIGKIAASQAEEVLLAAKKREQDSDVLHEIDKGLTLLKN